ncbi:M4 family metallopeptidase [Streptomyces sp. NY05-11A]|uniref:M4 family metallopeptidase n=1 Tax=Streptomyces soliscabiei TaxID=588897 RepID=UPI0029AD96F5|nr:M4 family metallopeptidase [Streptomyces sp. NY05-11A]MDX2682664.1 M4 family metallopeptidase [Streptomyces sp. NY05-11A]
MLAATFPVGTANAGSGQEQQEQRRTKRINDEARPGAAPVDLTPAERRALLKAADGRSSATAGALGLGAKEKLVPRDVTKDADGTVHTRYERTFAGLPVLGGDLVVHTHGESRTVSRATGARISVSTSEPSVAAATAKKTALNAAKAGGDKQGRADGAPRLVVWAADGTPTLAWEAVVTGVQDDGSPSKLHVITDATTGSKLREFQTVQSAVGHGQLNGTVDIDTTRNGDTYDLYDSTRNHKTYDQNGGGWEEPGTLFTDADDVWGDGLPGNRQTAAVDAAYGAKATWDFYHDTFGRNGIADDGRETSSRVHYGDGEITAFWDDGCFCMTYGDGEGNQRPFTSLDVAAHEMTHGVTSATAKLGLSGEASALNEATSDIMATATEFFADVPQDTPDYLIGELIDANGDGTPLRYMDKPSKDGDSQDYWTPETVRTDAHDAAGIANHFFYLLSEGSGAKTVNGVAYDSPTYDGLPVSGIGIQNAQQIWYRALTTYMTSTTDYMGARSATLQAAADLFGPTSGTYEAVGNSWAAVNVGARFVDGIAFTQPADQTDAAGQPAELKIEALSTAAGDLSYSATGLPDGLSIDSASGLISGLPAKTGVFHPTVMVSAASGQSARRTFAWTVIPSGGDFFVNPADMTIAEEGGLIESPILVTGRAGDAPTALKVSVDIVHSYRGALEIDLVGPSGAAYRLKDANGRDSEDDVHETYTVDASAEPAEGTWKLRVWQKYWVGFGSLDSWKLTF